MTEMFCHSCLCRRLRLSVEVQGLPRDVFRVQRGKRSYACHACVSNWGIVTPSKH